MSAATDVDRQLSVAILIPCFNEATTIADVVREFARSIASATIYVYDNNSTDNTAEVAHAAGAIVRREYKQGKGNVVRRMFADVEADIYVMVDGDMTYDASIASKMVRRLIDENLDMVVGRRVHKGAMAYRRGHVVGNRLFTAAVDYLFGRSFKDILSGYRVFSRRYVKSFPMLSAGFEVETEMAIHALTLRMATAEVDTVYLARPKGSQSKLSTYRDGLKILKKIVVLLKNEKPFVLFSSLGAFCVALSLGLGIPVVDVFLRTGLVERLPTAVLAASLMVIGIGLFGLAIALDSLGRFRAEMRRLAYLSHTSVSATVISPRGVTASERRAS